MVPLLFNIYMIDLPGCVNSKIVQYADDSTIYRAVKSPDDTKILQDDLTNIAVWCANNGMELNTDKCKVMDITFSSRSLTPHYSIGEQPLEYCEQEKLLGIYVTPDLKFIFKLSMLGSKQAKFLALYRATSMVARLELSV